MTKGNLEQTMMFRVNKEDLPAAREVLMTVYQALQEKGYNPINQLVGYLLSGDPAYITSHNNARNLIRKLERDELLEELLRHYLEIE
ncbi:MAG TPA: IreB family regulatory phosphoprotein [Clostridia bacterium]|nr:IreB family regulatory phosphoprotein [Clostridia bacterium]